MAPEAYAFTEGLTFIFPPETLPATALADESTPAGQIWATTLKTYLELDQVGTVYWAVLPEASQTTKLLIEWKTSAAHDEFNASPESSALRKSWDSIIAQPVKNTIYEWGTPGVRRQTALGSDHNTVSCLFTWTFRDGSTPNQEQWEAAFHPFSKAMMSSPVGGIYSYCTHGWQLNATPASYTAAYHTHSMESTKEWLATAEVQTLLERIVSEGGAMDLKVEYMEMKVYACGWCGSVMRIYPEIPNEANFLARLRGG
ncbi:hypothetical protein CC79DRAFT_1335339 [Sarocladium strictum]